MTNLFLFFVFFSPRLILAICYLAGEMPSNTTPFIVDVIAFFIAPHLLVAWWLYEADAHPLLTTIFVVLGFIELLGGSASRRANRDGNIGN